MPHFCVHKTAPRNASARNRRARSGRSKALQCVAVWLGLVIGCVAAGVSSESRAAPVTVGGFKVDIATNLLWLDNAADPLVDLKASRQSVMQRLASDSKPCLRVINQSNLDLFGIELDLSNANSWINGCEWLSVSGQPTWNWDEASRTALFQFACD